MTSATSERAVDRSPVGPARATTCRPGIRVVAGPGASAAAAPRCGAPGPPDSPRPALTEWRLTEFPAWVATRPAGRYPDHIRVRQPIPITKG
jgi:hypothetical protein